MVSVVCVGAGEYTVGYVQTQHGAAPDKPAGVVALTCFDLRRLGLVDNIAVCDRTGQHFPQIRQVLQEKIGSVYKGLDIAIKTFPEDNVRENSEAYLQAFKSSSPGDVCIIFTPDNTHFSIAMAAIEHGLHVLVAKPAVKLLDHHIQLVKAAKERNVMVAVEYHKRFDPIYMDARNRINNLGGFSYFYSLMTQPKRQLETFKSWAGRLSDISYYLNSHHIDVHNWSVAHFARPVRVVAMAATGVAKQIVERDCEDTITLVVQWKNNDGSQGTAVYTSSWIAPKADCHTQQQFHYMGHKGEVRVDQAHRGYNGSTDEAGYAALNPLYMRYVPDAMGRFVGQTGYGYQSIAQFISSAKALNQGEVTLEDLKAEGQLALIEGCLPVTAILEAGRVSLDNSGTAVSIQYDAEGLPSGLKLELAGVELSR